MALPLKKVFLRLPLLIYPCEIVIPKNILQCENVKVKTLRELRGVKKKLLESKYNMEDFPFIFFTRKVLIEFYLKHLFLAFTTLHLHFN